MIKIVITGPESTGKTTLSAALTAHYHARWVPEYSREYLEVRGPLYTEADLLEIAKGQVHREDQAIADGGALLFFDTSLEVIKVWSEVRFRRCHPWIEGQLQRRRPDGYLLCRPDLPWQYDPLRENPHDRHLLYERYLEGLVGQPGMPWLGLVEGRGRVRTQNAIRLLNNNALVLPEGRRK